MLVSSPEKVVSLSCRSIRIGSYKVVTDQKVCFTKSGIFFKLPFLTDQNTLIEIKIHHHEVVKFEALLCRRMPLFFIDTTSEACERIRNNLNLNYEHLGLFYDVKSLNETMKRIVMVPEKLPEDRELLKNFYSEVISELNVKRANEMLVKSTPTSESMQNQINLWNNKK